MEERGGSEGLIRLDAEASVEYKGGKSSIVCALADIARYINRHTK